MMLKDKKGEVEHVIQQIMDENHVSIILFANGYMCH